MFDRIDSEEDGEVYLREVVDYLAVLDNNTEQSHRVSREYTTSQGTDTAFYIDKVWSLYC